MMNALSDLFVTDAEVMGAAARPMIRDDARTLDLTEASLLEPDPGAERARLRSRQFIRARIVNWTADDSSAVVSVTLYELERTEQASLAVLDIREALRAAGARMGTLAGFVSAVMPSDQGDVAAVSFAVGPVHAVIASSPAGTVDDLAIVEGVALLQHARLATAP